VRATLLLLAFLPFSCSGIQQSEDEWAHDNGKEVVCFVYHRFGDSRYPSTNISVKDFAAHLAWLKKNNFTIVKFSEAIDYINADGPERKLAVITIDDGYKSFFNNGLPLLRKYGAPATLFINTKTVGGGDYMDWHQLEIVVESDVEIGNHTHSHAFFLNENANTRYKTFEDEINFSQATIERKLNITPVVFSYPYGEFDSEMKRIAKAAGFKAAAAQNSGVIYSGSDLFMCPRFPMSESYSAIEKFTEKASARALKVTHVSHDSFVVPADKRPALKLTIKSKDLSLNRLQCFVQGYDCSLKILEKNDSTTVIEVQSDKPMVKKRRTLYTVTVPDRNGQWHWYSHVWINPAMKE